MDPFILAVILTNLAGGVSVAQFAANLFNQPTSDDNGNDSPDDKKFDSMQIIESEPETIRHIKTYFRQNTSSISINQTQEFKYTAEEMFSIQATDELKARIASSIGTGTATELAFSAKLEAAFEALIRNSSSQELKKYITETTSMEFTIPANKRIIIEVEWAETWTQGSIILGESKSPFSILQSVDCASVQVKEESI